MDTVSYDENNMFKPNAEFNATLKKIEADYIKKEGKRKADNDDTFE